MTLKKEIKMEKNFEETLMNFMVLLRERDEKHILENFPSLSPKLWDVTFGRKYAKVIHDRSVYAFIDISNGDIYMPAGWNAPAKHVRGNIFGDDPLAGTGVYGVDYLK
jgi:hypothetical protein